MVVVSAAVPAEYASVYSELVKPAVPVTPTPAPTAYAGKLKAFIRTEWLDNNGYVYPTSWAGLCDIVRAVNVEKLDLNRNGEQDEIGFAVPDGYTVYDTLCVVASGMSA